MRLTFLGVPYGIKGGTPASKDLCEAETLWVKLTAWLKGTERKRKMLKHQKTKTKKQLKAVHWNMCTLSLQERWLFH